MLTHPAIDRVEKCWTGLKNVEPYIMCVCVYSAGGPAHKTGAFFDSLSLVRNVHEIILTNFNKLSSQQGLSVKSTTRFSLASPVPLAL